MGPDVLSLSALVAAIVLSMTSRVNVGLAAMALAWLVGRYAAGQTPEAILRGFPAPLFVTLVGVSLLFAVAETNGTLARLASRAVAATRGNVRLLPVLFFFVAAGISGVGPGAISAVALVAPLAMSIGGPAGVPPLVMALVVANGANAANLSPVSAVGIIANTKMSEAGLAGHEGAVFAATFAASLLVALAGVLLFGRRAAAPPGGEPALAAARRLEPAQRLTVGVMALWMIGALVWQLPVGLSALAAAVVLMLARAGDERGVIARVPWSVVLMVSGVSMLVAVVETAGGLRLFTAALAALATPGTVNGVVALVTGGISLWSSTSGVVLPAFLPLAPGLVASVGGGDPVAVSISMTVGSSLVDVSPLSTLGALCITAAGDRDPGGRLFRQLLLWGVAMAFAGALYCQAVAGAIARL